MYELVIHKDAEADLDDIWESDADRAADVEVLLGEIRADQELLAAMQVHQRKEGRLHVSRLLKFEIWGRLLWRLKFGILQAENDDDTSPYRIIYGSLGTIYYVLAVVHRNRNYETDRELAKRVRAACRELGIVVPPN
jgi:hypothetical protein